MVQLEATRRSQWRRLREHRARHGRRSAATERADARDGQLASAPGAVPVAGGVLSAMPFNFSFTGSYFDLSASSPGSSTS